MSKCLMMVDPNCSSRCLLQRALMIAFDDVVVAVFLQLVYAEIQCDFAPHVIYMWRNARLFVEYRPMPLSSPQHL